MSVRLGDKVISGLGATLPAQAGHAGQFLTTNGSVASWDNVDSLPDQLGHAGQFLTTNGQAPSWGTVAIPTVDQTYNASSTNAQSGVAVDSAISSAISSVYKPAGSVVFASLPTLSSSIEGKVYNVTNSFTTTSDFVEGAGNSYPAGTNVVCINTSGTTYKWDVLAGFIDLSGYQETLVSGTNIKTINNTTILGSGNIDTHELPSQTGNSGKFLTTNGTTASWGNVTIPYGESTSAADAVQKEVTISEITELKTGQIIIVNPTITSTVADATLKLNNFTAYPMLYGAAAITTSTDSITWAANYPSWFRFDGSNWVFLGHGVDNNTTYSAMSVAEGTTGTKTTARSVRADYLKQIIQGTTLTGLSTSTNSAVIASDTITNGIGKLQAQVNNKVDKVSTVSKIYATNASGNQTTLSYSASATGNTVPIRGSSGTIEATTPYADSHVTTKQYVDNLVKNMQTTLNLVTSVSSSSTDSQYPSAKLFYDTVGDIEAALHTINSGGDNVVNLTVNLTGRYQSGFSKLTINNNNYSLSDFNNGTKTIQVPKNETLNWSVTVTSYSFEASPSSGTLNLTDDSTLTINIRQVEPT